jgi:hypothetical protein
MKQKPTFKSLLVVACILSFSAFVFVNVHSNFAVQKPAISAGFVPSQVEEEDHETQSIAVPDVTVLGRLWSIAQKLLDSKN